jgi:hypothetical protein
MKRLLVAAVTGFVCALLAARPVLARDDEDPVPPPAFAPAGQTHAPRWYGWELILLDAASVATFEEGDFGRSTPLMLVGGISYVALGPIVHAANGRKDRVVSSLLLRLAAPVVGVAAAIVIGRQNDAVYTTLYIPIVAVSLFDAIRASRLPEDAVASSPASAAQVAWLPTIAPTVVGAGATVGLVGAF